MNERFSAARVALLLILPALALACSGSSSDPTVHADAAPVVTNGAQIKFCNALALPGNANLRLSLKVGDPPLVMTANSGECSTPVGTACKMVGAGMGVPVQLVDDMDQDIASGTVDIGAGEQWMMVATISSSTGKPTVRGGPLMAQYACSTLDPFMVPDGGTMDPGSPDAGAGQ